MKCLTEMFSPSSYGWLWPRPLQNYFGFEEKLTNKEHFRTWYCVEKLLAFLKESLKL